jgi:hypothetical protein
MAKSDADDPVQEDRMVRRLLVGLMAASTEGFTETGTLVAVPLADPEPADLHRHVSRAQWLLYPERPKHQ